MSSSATEEMLDPAAPVGAPDGNTIDKGSSSKKLGRWATKGGLAILDQGLISGSNFLIGILLAPGLGAFTVAMAAWVAIRCIWMELHSVRETAQAIGPGRRDC